MQIRFGGRWAVVFSCVLFTAAVHAASPDAASSVDALRDIATRLDAAIGARAARHAPAAVTADAAKRARGELDALVRTAARAGFAGDTTFVRKLAQVRRLEANLDRAAASAIGSAIPVPTATADALRTTHARRGDGASCASAIPLGLDDAVESRLAHGAALWLRVAPRDARFVRLDTLATPLDTEITLFGAACPASDVEAVASDDDAYGLAAMITIDTARNAGVRYARVRNLGHVGRAIAHLSTTGAFVGRITDARNSHGLAAYVETISSDGYVGVQTSTDPDSGLYLLSSDPGSFYILAASPNNPGAPFVPELYPDAPCEGYFFGLESCATSAATLLTLADGQQLAGVDIALNLGGRVAGTVRDASTGAAIAGASVQLYAPDGDILSYGTATDAAGRYLIGGLMTGTVYAIAFADGHGGQVFDHVACTDPAQNTCWPLDGTPISVVRDQTTAGVDFDLPPLAHVHASVSTRDGDPPPYASWSISIVDASGTTYSMSFGTFDQDIVSQALPPGTYRVFAYADGFFGQLWHGIDCPTDCLAMVDQGAAVTLAPGGVAELSFSLLAMPEVSGMITDAATHAPLQNIAVTLLSIDPDIPYGYTATTDFAGHYAVTNAPPGSYYVFATSSDYRSTIYPDVPCPYPYECDFTSATSVTTVFGGADIPGIDFALPVNGTISGHVRLRVPDGMTFAPLLPAYETVNIYDANSNYYGYAYVNADGSYALGGFPAGTYHAIARGDSFDQAWGGVDCGDGCDNDAGTPIVLAQSQTASGIDFNPYPRYWIFGHVSDASAAPVPGVPIDLWRSADGTHCGAAETNADGDYALTDLGACGDTHKLSTDAPAPWINQVYDGIPCPDGSAWLGLCSIDNGSNVPFPTSPSFRVANFNLGQRPDPIFADGFDD